MTLERIAELEHDVETLRPFHCIGVRDIVELCQLAKKALLLQTSTEPAE